MQTAETPYPKSTFVYGDTGQVYSQASDPYTLLLERVRALEVIVANLRDELAALEAKVEALEMLTTLMRDELYEMRDGALEDIAAVLDEEDPDGWIGGTDD